MNLSPHFTLEEMTFSQTALRRGTDNDPNASVVTNLAILCRDFLEPIRERFGPIYVSSGFRSMAVNFLIGGSPTSAHIDGRAADIQCAAPPLAVVEWILDSTLDFDQVIYEYSAWTHIGMARPGISGRKQALMIFDRTAGYAPFDARKIRGAG